MQIGDVDFDTAARTPSGDFVFAGVANPEEVVDRVHHATEPSRRRQPRRPRSAAPASATSRDRRPPLQAGVDRGGLATPAAVAQRVDAVGPLPGEVLVVAAEVAVGGGRLVDRPVQVEVAAERAGTEVEDLA